MIDADPIHNISRGDDGFTLIEMLVAVALLSIMMVLLIGAIGNARVALAFVERANVVTPVYSAQNYLRSALLQARAKQRGLDSNDREIGFLGDAQNMTFTTSFAPNGQFGGLYQVRIGLERSAGGQSYELIVTQALDRPASNDERAAVPKLRAVLIENVEAVAFSYFGPKEDKPAPEWLDGWSQTYRLPALVSIELKFARGDSRTWYRLIVPLFASDASAIPCPPRVPCL
jgi:general secretion pathway protein J